jgi:hypothetical protein
MTDIKNIEVLLERIATALESIAINRTIVTSAQASIGNETDTEISINQLPKQRQVLLTLA